MAPWEIHLHLIDISVSFHQMNTGNTDWWCSGEEQNTFKNKYVDQMKTEHDVFMLI